MFFRSMSLPTRLIGFSKPVVVSVPELSCRCFIHKHRGIQVLLQNRRRTNLAQWPFSQSSNGFCLVATSGQQHEMPGATDRAKTLGQHVNWHVTCGFKEACVVRNSAGVQ